MTKLGKKLNRFGWNVRFKATGLANNMKNSAKNIIRNEDGDTNFISIIIILAIVLLVAIVFIAFKDKIVKMLDDTWNKFSQSVNSQDTFTPEDLSPP